MNAHATLHHEAALDARLTREMAGEAAFELVPFPVLRATLETTVDELEARWASNRARRNGERAS